MGRHEANRTAFLFSIHSSSRKAITSPDMESTLDDYVHSQPILALEEEEREPAMPTTPPSPMRRLLERVHNF